MRILITGTSGFLGKSLKEHFEKQHQVIEYSRTGESLGVLVYSNSLDLVIHCAGEIYDATKMFNSNIVLVNELLTAIKEYSPKTRLIQLGSSAEHGPMPRASNEQDAINPVDVYQATKGAATLLCQGYARQFDIDTCVARIYSGYGANERTHRLFPTLYRAFFHNEEMTLRDGFHDFIYIKDFVRGLDILSNSQWPKGEIVNFGSGIQSSNLEVLNTWRTITGKTGNVKYEPGLSKAYESKVWQCDTAYAKMQYKFETEYSLEDGIHDFIKEMK